MWIEFSRGEEDQSPVGRVQKEPEHQVGSASPQTQLTPGKGACRALHPCSCQAGSGKQVIISLPSGVPFETLQQKI